VILCLFAVLAGRAPVVRQDAEALSVH